MLALAFLVVTTAAQRRTDNTGTTLIALTVNEFRRLFDALLLRPLHTVAHIPAWSTRPETTGVQWSSPPPVRRAFHARRWRKRTTGPLTYLQTGA